MEPARHPFPVSSTARTIGEQKAKVKTFSKMSIDVGWSGQADIWRFAGRLAARASKSKSEQDDEVPEQERSHNPTQNRGDLLLIYLHEVGALLDNLFIRLYLNFGASESRTLHSEGATLCLLLHLRFN